MKRNYIKSILTLFTLAIILCGAAGAANAQVNPAQAQYRKALDFDGDGKVDMTVTRSRFGTPSTVWYSRDSQSGSLRAASWGKVSSLDFTTPGDYDGDGKADYAIIRRQEPASVWHIMLSGSGSYRTLAFGTPNPSDTPMAADYDGDGKTDIAVVRKGGGSLPLVWYIQQSSNNQLATRTIARDPEGEFCAAQQGVDIDGDGKQDFAQICKAVGRDLMIWSITRSSNNVVERYFFGINSDNLIDAAVPGDYDGDGKTDIAVVRSVNVGGGSNRYVWYIRRSSDGVIQSTQFGASESSYYDTAVQADYDGDGKTDICVFRSFVANGQPSTFYLLRSGSGGSLQVVQWGTTGDYPLTIFPGFFTF